MIHHMSQDTLLTTPQLSALVGLDPRTVRREADAGNLTIAGRIPGTRGAYLFDITHPTNRQFLAIRLEQLRHSRDELDARIDSLGELVGA